MHVQFNHCFFSKTIQPLVRREKTLLKKTLICFLSGCKPWSRAHFMLQEAMTSQNGKGKKERSGNRISKKGINKIACKTHALMQILTTEKYDNFLVLCTGNHVLESMIIES